MLVGACAIGLLGPAAFVADPISGYPPGTPNVAQQISVQSALHQLLSAFFFVGLPAACFVFARRITRWHELGWAIYSAATGVAFVAAFVLASAAFGQSESLVAFGGLFQRIAVTAGRTWLSLLAVHMLVKT